MAKIGVRLRELRRRRQLTVRELSARAGLSHSTISLIERDHISPSVDSLAAVLDALGTTLSTFFANLVSETPYRVFHMAADMVEIGDTATISYKMVGADRPDRHLLLLHEAYVPSADTGDVFSHSAQEAGIVILGRIELTVGGQTEVLTAGDGYYFDSSQPHRFRNPGPGRAEIISAVTPPTY